MSTQDAATKTVVELNDLPTDREKLGAGGEGIVYKLGSTRFTKGPCAYKEYKPTANIDEQRLETLVNFINKLGATMPERRDWLLQRAAWPTHVVRDKGKTVGILMPLIPERFYIDLTMGANKSSRRPAELQFLLNGAEYEQRMGLQVSEMQRYGILKDFADLLRVLHGTQIRVGDISVKNLLFASDPRGPRAYLLDCDSMSIGRHEGPEVQTPQWDVPNGEKPQTTHSDAYKFGLLALRLLVSDQRTRDAGNLPAGTPAPIRSLTQRALNGTKTTRPAVGDWLPAITAGEVTTSTAVAPNPAAVSGQSSEGQSTRTSTGASTRAGKNVKNRPKKGSKNSSITASSVASSAAASSSSHIAPSTWLPNAPSPTDLSTDDSDTIERPGLVWPIFWLVVGSVLLGLLLMDEDEPGILYMPIMIIGANILILWWRIAERRGQR